MQNNFECLINSFLEDNVGISDHFLSDLLTEQLKKNLNTLYSNQQFHAAGIGNDTVQGHNNTIRSDQIYWLDRAHNDLFENNFFDLMDLFVRFLNTTCYTGITGYEFHYARYEQGSFYKKHLDQFKNNKSRAFTMIMYLNEGWVEGDGGELRVFHSDHEQNISPNNGKCVFFKSSELEHEVLITNVPRLSITGWLRTD